MLLHASAQNHAARFRSVLVQKHFNALGRFPQADHFERAAQLAYHRFGRDAIVRQHIGLALRRRGPMAPHRGKKERNEPARFPVIHHRANNKVDVADPAASNADRDRGSRGKSCPEIRRAQFALHFTGNIFEAPVFKLLTDKKLTREFHATNYIAPECLRFLLLPLLCKHAGILLRGEDPEVERLFFHRLIRLHLLEADVRIIRKPVIVFQKHRRKRPDIRRLLKQTPNPDSPRKHRAPVRNAPLLQLLLHRFRRRIDNQRRKELRVRLHAHVPRTAQLIQTLLNPTEKRPSRGTTASGFPGTAPAARAHESPHTADSKSRPPEDLSPPATPPVTASGTEQLLE